MLLEKAKQYAEDCINGKEITTFEVKMQCKWFLEDLEKQFDDPISHFKKEVEILKKQFISKITTTFDINQDNTFEDDTFNIWSECDDDYYSGEVLEINFCPECGRKINPKYRWDNENN